MMSAELGSVATAWTAPTAGLLTDGIRDPVLMPVTVPGPCSTQAGKWGVMVPPASISRCSMASTA
jgi:hypothetical protein